MRAVKCIVTAGPTSEPLDAVRRLTNLSTGQLGTALSSHLVKRGHAVTLLRSVSAVAPLPVGSVQAVPFTTTANLTERLQELASSSVGAVFHAAAVSDFTGGRIWLRRSDGTLTEISSSKVSTRDGTLLAELVPTPKVISKLREFFPGAWLVGWKYEVDGGPAALMMRAEQQIVENKTDGCVMNGPAYGSGFGLLTGGGEFSHHADAAALCNALADLLEQQSPGSGHNSQIR